MKILVTYFSRSGQTKKVAESIFEAIPYAKEIHPINKVKNLDGYDLSFIGFPIEKFGPGDYIREWVGKRVADRNIALFITHAAPKNHPDLGKWLNECNHIMEEANIISRFNCQGELSEAFVKMASMIPDPLIQNFAKERPNTLGHPTLTELENAKSWVEGVLKAF